MSTKTSIKRIALVAVAALTLGGFSAVSANAVAGSSTTQPFFIKTADSGVQTSGQQDVTNTGTGVAGVYNYVELQASSNLASGAVLGVSVTGGGTISIPTQPSVGVETLTVTGATVASAGYQINNGVIRVQSPTAGTLTISVSKNVTTNGVTTTTLLQTFTFTINAASVVGAYSAGNSFAVRIDTTTTNVQAFAAYETVNASLSSATADSTAAITKGTAGAIAPQSIIAVRIRDTQSTPAALAGKTVSASITGPGLVQGTGTASDTASVTSFGYAGTVAATVGTSTTDAAGWAWFNVLNSGQSGTGTVTISYTDGNGVSYTVATKTFVFYGAIASLKATQGKYIVANSGSATGGTTSTTYAVQLTGADAAGNAVDITGYSITATSSVTGAIANASISTSSGCAADATLTTALDCSVTGVSGAAAGTAVTVTYSYTDANGTVFSTAAIPYVLGGTTVSALAVSFDKASYNVGDLVTMTLTAKDSLGNKVADALYSLFDTTSSTTVFATSAQLTSTPFGSRYVTLKNGIATATFYAPYTSGNLAMTATVGGTTGTAWNNAAAALAGTTVTGTVVINNGATGGDAALALDAANAATDAANNAYDEAQNATQAAQDALAAVTALAKQVSSLIASVKSLTALVSKIKAKVGA